MINAQEFRKETFVKKIKEIDPTENCYFQLLEDLTNQFFVPKAFKSYLAEKKEDDYLFFNKLIPIKDNDVEGIFKPQSWSVSLNRGVTHYEIDVKNPDRVLLHLYQGSSFVGDFSSDFTYSGDTYDKLKVFDDFGNVYNES